MTNHMKVPTRLRLNLLLALSLGVSASLSAARATELVGYAVLRPRSGQRPVCW